MSVMTGRVDHCHNRHDFIGDAINNAIEKVSRETPSGTKAPIAQPVDQRIRQQSVDGGNDFTG